MTKKKILVEGFDKNTGHVYLKTLTGKTSKTEARLAAQAKYFIGKLTTPEGLAAVQTATTDRIFELAKGVYIGERWPGRTWSLGDLQSFGAVRGKDEIGSNQASLD